MSTTTDDLQLNQTVLEGIGDGEIHSHSVLLNKIVRALSFMMPGIMLSDPASKKGTTSERTWRTEAFTFTFRGKRTAAAAQEKAFTNSTHDVAGSKQAWFALSVQTDGTTFTITKAADQTIGTDVYPTGPDNELIVSLLKIVTGATGWLATDEDLEVSGTKITSLTFVDNPGLAVLGNESSVEVTT